MTAWRVRAVLDVEIAVVSGNWEIMGRFELWSLQKGESFPKI